MTVEQLVAEFRKLEQRVEELENEVGEPRVGFSHAKRIDDLEEQVETLRRNMATRI